MARWALTTARYFTAVGSLDPGTRASRPTSKCLQDVPDDLKGPCRHQGRGLESARAILLRRKAAEQTGSQALRSAGGGERQGGLAAAFGDFLRGVTLKAGTSRRRPKDDGSELNFCTIATLQIRGQRVLGPGRAQGPPRFFVWIKATAGDFLAWRETVILLDLGGRLSAC